MTEVLTEPVVRTNADPFVEPLSLLTSELGRIAAEIHAVECSHAERIEAAAAAVRGQLREQVAAELRRQLEREFEAEVQKVHAEYEKRAAAASAAWETEP